MFRSSIDESHDKQQKYSVLIEELDRLLDLDVPPLSNVCNALAHLWSAFQWHWVGLYFVENERTLALGPFIGPVACTRIEWGKGVCGKAWQRREVILVDDVAAFEGHIACSPLSKSEIVVPFGESENIWGVLDVDSDRLCAFDGVDASYLSLWLGKMRSVLRPVWRAYFCKQ